jgi:uncharacterized protein (TIGR03000 family)
VFYGASSFAPAAPVVIGSSFYGNDMGNFPVITTEPVQHMSIDNTSNKEVRATVSKLSAAPARLTIEVPATAKLYVDGKLTNTMGSTRNFHTPDLPTGEQFYYTVKAELVIDGEPMVEEKKVQVRAGANITEAFPKLIAAAKNSNGTTLVKK